MYRLEGRPMNTIKLTDQSGNIGGEIVIKDQGMWEQFQRDIAAFQPKTKTNTPTRENVYDKAKRYLQEIELMDCSEEEKFRLQRAFIDKHFDKNYTLKPNTMID